MVLTGRECGTVVAVSGCIYWQVMVAVVSLGLQVMQDKLKVCNKGSGSPDWYFK